MTKAEQIFERIDFHDSVISRITLLNNDLVMNIQRCEHFDSGQNNDEGQLIFTSVHELTIDPPDRNLLSLTPEQDFEILRTQSTPAEHHQEKVTLVFTFNDYKTRTHDTIVIVFFCLGATWVLKK